MKRYATIVLVVIAAVLAGGAVYYQRALRPVEVEVASVEHNVEVRVFGIGTVEAQILSRVGFQISGKIATIAVDQGDTVDAGTPLATLEPSAQQARVAKAEIGILQAETALLKAKAQLARADANLSQKQAVNQRRQSLVDRGNVTQEAADDARTNEVLARADRDISAAELKVAEGARKDGAAALAIERVTLDQHVLSAPFRARVIARHKEQGSIAGIGEAVFTIIEPSSVWVRGFIDEARAGGIAVGQTAFVRLRSEMNRTVEAEIVRIDSENDRSTEERRLYVRCRTCRPEHQARFLGEQAEIEILQSVVPEGIFVPRRAVEGFDGMSGLVWTIENGALNQRRVGLGDQLRDGRIRIIDRLPEGARAIVTTATSAFSIGRAAKARELAKP